MPATASSSGGTARHHFLSKLNLILTRRNAAYTFDKINEDKNETIV